MDANIKGDFNLRAWPKTFSKVGLGHVLNFLNQKKLAKDSNP